MKKIFLSLILGLLGYSVPAQLTSHTLWSIGYQYQNTNFAEVGAKFLLLNNDDFLYRVGGSALLGEANDKWKVIPKLQGDILINTQKNVDISHSYYFLGGAEITPFYVAPKVGISIFGIVDFTGGYAFPFAKNRINGKELKHINLNFTINIPLVVLGGK